eukprot:1160068-Pelagomonas_calceolata.AAC.6
MQRDSSSNSDCYGLYYGPDKYDEDKRLNYVIQHYEGSWPLMLVDDTLLLCKTRDGRKQGWHKCQHDPETGEWQNVDEDTGKVIKNNSGIQPAKKCKTVGLDRAFEVMAQNLMTDRGTTALSNVTATPTVLFATWTMSTIAISSTQRGYQRGKLFRALRDIGPL